MKLRNKTLLAIVATFSCLSLFCVGFANWAVGQGATSVTGTISAEEVKESSYYIAFFSIAGSDNSTPFKFDTDGFIVGSGRQLSTKFSVTYNFFPGHVYVFTPKKAKVTVSLGSPKVEGGDSFLKNDYISATAAYGVEEQTELKAQRNPSANTFDVSFNIDMSGYQNYGEGFIPIKVDYTISFSNMGDYTKYIVDVFAGKNGSNLNGAVSTLSLSFSASVMDGGAA